MINLTDVTAKEVREVAASVNNKEQKDQLLRLAQQMDSMQDVYSSNEFDPSQTEEPGLGLDSGGTEFDPSQMDVPGEQVPFANETGSSSKVPIESFVKVDGQTAAPSNYTEHTCSVLFKAPKDTQESDMMNYILGIGKELGVEVTKFEWEKLPPKENKIK